MPVIENVLILSAYHLRLLVRSRAKLLVIAALPLLAGVFLSLASGGTNRVTTYGAFVILPLSSLLMASVLRADGLLPHTPNELVSLPIARGAEALAVLGVLVAQAAVYVLLTGILSRAPAIGTLALALIVSPAVGIAFSTLMPSETN
jgi:hypothetical protein